MSLTPRWLALPAAHLHPEGASNWFSTPLTWQWSRYWAACTSRCEPAPIPWARPGALVHRIVPDAYTRRRPTESARVVQGDAASVEQLGGGVEEPDVPPAGRSRRMALRSERG